MNSVFTGINQQMKKIWPWTRIEQRKDRDELLERLRLFLAQPRWSLASAEAKAGADKASGSANGLSTTMAGICKNDLCLWHDNLTYTGGYWPFIYLYDEQTGDFLNYSCWRGYWDIPNLIKAMGSRLFDLSPEGQALIRERAQKESDLRERNAHFCRRMA